MDISHVPELVDRVAYALMIESYERQAIVYPSLCEVAPLTDDILYGDKISVMATMGELKDRLDGGQIEADEFFSGPTAYIKVRQQARRLVLPERMVLASDAVGRITSLLQTQARTWGEIAAIQKDDAVADVLQKGTLTAGSAPDFDGSFPGNADPYPKFIYDGLPFFDTAHTITGGSSTYANHTVSLALTKVNLETTLTTMRTTNAVDERGNRIVIRPDTLIVPPGLEYTARTILESTQLPGSANNDVNTSRGSLDLVVWNALDDAASASSWWLAQRGRGLRFIDGGQPALETYWDPSIKSWNVSAEIHYGVGVTNWRYWYAANKAAS